MGFDFDLRQQERIALAMPGRLKTVEGARECVAVIDMSATGCRITAIDNDLFEGQSILFRADRIEGIKARVRWRDGNRAGLEFDRPFYMPVVEHLQKAWPLPEVEDIHLWINGPANAMKRSWPDYLLKIIARAEQIDKELSSPNVAQLTERKALGLRLRYC